MKKIICSFAFAFVASTFAAHAAFALVPDFGGDQEKYNDYSNQITGGGGTTKLRCAPGKGYSPARYDSSGNEICVGSSTIDRPILNPDLPVINPDLGKVDLDKFVDWIPETTASTVESCPTGMKKNTDGCCCVNN